MDAVDKEHVKRVVYEMSQGSAHFKNEQRKEAAVLERVARMKAKLNNLTSAEISANERAADSCIAVLEATRLVPALCVLSILLQSVTFDARAYMI
jgi:hypothetical protein